MPVSAARSCWLPGSSESSTWAISGPMRLAASAKLPVPSYVAFPPVVSSSRARSASDWSPASCSSSQTAARCVGPPSASVGSGIGVPIVTACRCASMLIGESAQRAGARR